MASKETAAIISYQKSTGVPARVTSVDDSVHGTNSRHYQAGTGGRGLAVDFGGPHSFAVAPKLAALEMLAIAQAFKPVEHLLYELIHTGLGYSIKNGKKVAMYAVADHHNHVHVSVNKGVLLAAPKPSATAPPVKMEVPPMFDPFTVIERVVATLKAPGGGVWMMDEGGHIYGLEGANVYDMPARHPEYWRPGQKARRLEALGAGYQVIDSDGHFYDYPA